MRWSGDSRGRSVAPCRGSYCKFLPAHSVYLLGGRRPRALLSLRLELESRGRGMHRGSLGGRTRTRSQRIGSHRGRSDASSAGQSYDRLTGLQPRLRVLCTREPVDVYCTAGRQRAAAPKELHAHVFCGLQIEWMRCPTMLFLLSGLLILK